MIPLSTMVDKKTGQPFIIRQAKPQDLPVIKRLARKYGLLTDDFKTKEFLVARPAGRIIGFGRIKVRGRLKELASLGVVPSARKSGVGQALVRALVEKAGGTVYLATVIPRFFRRLGFKVVRRIPRELRRKAAYCRGCQPKLCRVMANYVTF